MAICCNIALCMHRLVHANANTMSTQKGHVACVVGACNTNVAPSLHSGLMLKSLYG